MEIKISLSSSDLERIKNALGIAEYDDIHAAMVEAFDYMLERKEKTADEVEKEERDYDEE